MEPTVLGLILDSSVVIEAERQRHTVPQLLRWVFHAVGEAEVAICSITVAELAHGVFRADTAERRECRRSFLDELKRTVPVFPITDEAGEIAGKLSAEGATRGLKLPFDDLLIGACALERGYGVATRNLRHFHRIPGLVVRQL
ncbi:MAG: type II toxin-antitoxin system VapC family toxin [Acidobacteria bacterium]|nr:type II toxin-antitoxin system VapC family toxin [Acidobacteriota bacterium]